MMEVNGNEVEQILISGILVTMNLKESTSMNRRMYEFPRRGDASGS